MLFKIIKLGLKLLKFKLNKKVGNEILLVAEYGKSGGTRTYLFYLMEFLYKQKANVTLLLNGSVQDDEIALAVKKYNFKTLEVSFDFWCTDMDNIPAGLTKKQLFQYEIKELNFWCDLQKKNHFSSIIFSVGNPEQYLYAFLLPVSIKYILHTAPLKNADWYKRKFLQYFLGAKKQIITVSEFARQSILHYWLEDKQSDFVHSVYNYYSPKHQDKKIITKTEIKTVLTIGSVEPYKNPLLFIETAKTIIAESYNKDIRFIWVGDGSMMETCKGLTLKHPEISFIGDTENVEELYEDATVYYQPSLLESHGISVLGAMYHHLPCVVSDNGGLKESVTEEIGFIVPVENAKASVEKIMRLLEDEVLRNKLGEKAFERYNLNFTQEQWEKEMMKRFENNV